MAHTRPETIGPVAVITPETIKWVDEVEKRVDAALAENKYEKQEEKDWVLLSVKAIAQREAAVSQNADWYVFGVEELERRYRAAGWDEARIERADGWLDLKWFRRRVFVSLDGVVLEVSAPVHEGESYEQAVRRLLSDGVTAQGDVSEPGIQWFAPSCIVRVRIPTHK